MHGLTVRDHAAHRLRRCRLPNTRQLPAFVVRELSKTVVRVIIAFRVSANNDNEGVMSIVPLTVTVALPVLAEHAECNVAHPLPQLQPSCGRHALNTHMIGVVQPTLARNVAA